MLVEVKGRMRDEIRLDLGPIPKVQVASISPSVGLGRGLALELYLDSASAKRGLSRELIKKKQTSYLAQGPRGILVPLQI